MCRRCIQGRLHHARLCVRAVCACVRGSVAMWLLCREQQASSVVISCLVCLVTVAINQLPAASLWSVSVDRLSG